MPNWVYDADNLRPKRITAGPGVSITDANDSITFGVTGSVGPQLITGTPNKLAVYNNNGELISSEFIVSGSAVFVPSGTVVINSKGVATGEALLVLNHRYPLDGSQPSLEFQVSGTYIASVVAVKSNSTLKILRLQAKNPDGVSFTSIDVVTGTIIGADRIVADRQIIADADDSGVVGGLFIGSDTQIFRSQANMLQTPDSLCIDADLYVSGTTNFWQACRAYISGSAQTIGHNSQTPVSFNAETFDTHGFHSGTSSQIYIPPGHSGKYLIYTNIAWDLSAGGSRRAISITVNDAIDIATDEISPEDAGAIYRHGISTVWQLNAGDFIKVNVYQDSGGNLNILNSGVQTPVLGIQRIG